MSALDAVFALERFGIKLGLENIRALCAALDNPQQTFPSVIVGGTNGKGSVVAMADFALRAAGHRVARYTSPHLVRVEERFVVDGREIETAVLERAASRTLRAIDALLAGRSLQAPPTFFEATTAMAFDVFRQAGAHVALLEVGLGGRLDATNVADAVAVAITSIDRDHEQQLGNTLEQIAFEKAGIIKAGRPVVLGPVDDGPRRVIAQVAAERHAALIEATERGGCRVEHTPDPVSANLITPVRPYSGVALGLAGEHQLSNALVAVRLLEVLDDCGIRIAAKAIVHGLSQVRWPGRLEWIDVPGGRLLLDAAHNPAGARSLADYLRSLKSGPLPLVFGLSRDKNLAAMLEALGPVVSRVIATQASTPRALSAREVAQQIREAAPRLEVSVVPDALEACRAALRASREAVVGGSIFLIGEVRGRLSK